MSSKQQDEANWCSDTEEKLFEPEFMQVSPKAGTSTRISRPMISKTVPTAKSSKLLAMKKIRFDAQETDSFSDFESNNGTNDTNARHKLLEVTKDLSRNNNKRLMNQLKTAIPSPAIASKIMHKEIFVPNYKRRNSSEKTQVKSMTEVIPNENKITSAEISRKRSIATKNGILSGKKDFQIQTKINQDGKLSSFKERTGASSSTFGNLDDNTQQTSMTGFAVDNSSKPFVFPKQQDEMKRHKKTLSLSLNKPKKTRYFENSKTQESEDLNQKQSTERFPPNPNAVNSRHRKQDPTDEVKSKGNIKQIDGHWRQRFAKDFERLSGQKLKQNLNIPTTSNRSSQFLTQAVKNDGNSLFRSISFILFGKEGYFQTVRDVITGFMFANKLLMNHLCSENGFSGVFEDFVRETKATDTGRQTIRGFLELNVIAYYFKTPVYLFTRPITEMPTEFLHTNISNLDSAFILFKENGYFCPVLQFDGRMFNHVDIGDKTLIEFSNNSRIFKVPLIVSQSFSTELTNKAIVKGHKLETKLRDTSMDMIISFFKGDYKSIDADVELFNFSCDETCPTLTEIIISRFNEMEDLMLMSKFLHMITGNGMRYKEELLTIFSNKCFNACIEKLCKLEITDKRVRDTVENVLMFMRGYVASTKQVDIRLDDGTFAFRDIIPFTAICVDPHAEKMFYFTGPKPNVQRWIEIKLNPSLMGFLGRMTRSGQMFFNGISAMFWMKERNNSYRLYVLDNVFDFTEKLCCYEVPKTPYRIENLQFVKSDKNKLYLFDQHTHQLFDLEKQQWVEIEEVFFPHMVKNEDYQLINVIEKNSNDNSKLRILFSREQGSSLANFASITPDNSQIPLIPFQYSFQKVDEWKVKRRLQDDNISLDPQKSFEERQQLMYKQVEPFVQYVVPSMEQKDCIYALIETDVLNKSIQDSEFRNLSETFVTSYTTPNEMVFVAQGMGYNVTTFLKIVKVNDQKSIYKLIELWYPVAQRECASHGVSPRDLLADAYHKANRNDLFENITKFNTERRKFIQTNTPLFDAIRGQMKMELEEIKK